MVEVGKACHKHLEKGGELPTGNDLTKCLEKLGCAPKKLGPFRVFLDNYIKSVGTFVPGTFVPFFQECIKRYKEAKQSKGPKLKLSKRKPPSTTTSTTSVKRMKGGTSSVDESGKRNRRGKGKRSSRLHKNQTHLDTKEVRAT
jgi:hypothetical protein